MEVVVKNKKFYSVTALDVWETAIRQTRAKFSFKMQFIAAN